MFDHASKCLLEDIANSTDDLQMLDRLFDERSSQRQNSVLRISMSINPVQHSSMEKGKHRNDAIKGSKSTPSHDKLQQS